MQACSRAARPQRAIGKPDDIRVRALDSRDESRRQSLNGVGARLVAPFPARDVPGDLVVGQRCKMPPSSSRRSRPRRQASAGSRRSGPRDCARTGAGQHGRGLRSSRGLPRIVAVDDDRRVRAEDHESALLRRVRVRHRDAGWRRHAGSVRLQPDAWDGSIQARRRFLRRQPPHVRRRRLARREPLVDIRATVSKSNPAARSSSARRGDAEARTRRMDNLQCTIRN